MTPVFVSRWPVLKKWEYPLDSFLHWNGQRVLGEHKTVRGLVCGVLAAILTCQLQFLLLHYGNGVGNWLHAWAPSAYLVVNPIKLGAALGFGALIGDAVKSFFKRQLRIPSGATFLPFDQLDFVLGGILFSLLVVHLPILTYIFLIVSYPFLHFLTTCLGYLLKLKSAPI